ncbi:MAG: SpoIIE family protein phosphatase [Gammaproteobacteria bacterium]|nr:SpoIIE family protein phosphatase [Gammaproteobacteria bacterium]
MKLLIEQGAKGDSGVVLLRSKLRAVSRRMGFSDLKREQMELVCNEMVTNQNKFADGNGLVQIWETAHPGPALDLFAFDYGKGIPNIKAAQQDGYTTAGTMGKGLGAIRRLSSESEIYSIAEEYAGENPWHGTAVWARFHQDDHDAALPHQIGSYARSYQDSAFNGDLIQVRCGPHKTRWLHMDGLGHGREAAEVVEGIGYFLDDETPVDGLMQRLSQRLQGTRGAVAMICEVDAVEQTFKVCGVGDMVAYLISSGDKKAISFSPGVLGHAHRTPETTTLSFPPQALLLTASDGLRRSITLRTFPELWRLHPQMIALVLGQVMGRHNDDRSVFTIRVNPSMRT